MFAYFSVRKKHTKIGRKNGHLLAKKGRLQEIQRKRNPSLKKCTVVILSAPASPLWPGTGFRPGPVRMCDWVHSLLPTSSPLPCVEAPPIPNALVLDRRSTSEVENHLVYAVAHQPRRGAMVRPSAPGGGQQLVPQRDALPGQHGGRGADHLQQLVCPHHVHQRVLLRRGEAALSPTGRTFNTTTTEKKGCNMGVHSCRLLHNSPPQA